MVAARITKLGEGSYAIDQPGLTMVVQRYRELAGSLLAIAAERNGARFAVQVQIEPSSRRTN